MGYMIGTKFYKYTGDSKIPVIMRYIGDDSGYMALSASGANIILEKKEFFYALIAGEFKVIDLKRNSMSLTRSIDGMKRNEFWTFKVDENPGLGPLEDIDTIYNSDQKFLSFNVTAGPIDMKKPEEIANEYTKLTPDGYMTFSIVDMKQGKDIIITLNKRDSKIPFAVCRQNVQDIWERDGVNKSFGCSVTSKNVPENTFMMFLDSDNIKEFQARAVYIDDDMHTILSMISPSKYKSAFKEISADYRKALGSSKYICNSLEELLNTTGFYKDFCSCFGVPLYYKPLPLNTTEFTDVVGFNTYMKNNYYSTVLYDHILYIPFDKTLDLSKLDRNYMIISTPISKGNHRLFVLTYDEYKK